MSNKKKIIGSIVILIIVSMFLLVHIKNGSEPAKKAGDSDIFVENGSMENKSTKCIKVCIKGGIKHPGVYSLEDGSIVGDIIDKAGGFSRDADMEWVEKKLNLARKIKSEDFIYIVKKVDSDNSKGMQNIEKTYNDDGILDINSASSEELQKIDGIGPSTAQKIIEYREKNNGFKNIEELKNIERIGDKTFEKLKDKFVVR